MSIFRRKLPKQLKQHTDLGDLVNRLRDAEQCLKGWTVYGDGFVLDRLLLEAASALDAIDREMPELSENGRWVPISETHLSWGNDTILVRDTGDHHEIWIP